MRLLAGQTFTTVAALGAVAAAVFAAPAVMAQDDATTQGPTQAQLADTVKLGSIASLAPLCGLREDAWAADLRRAAIQAATSSKAHEDADLQAAPGSNLAAGALSFADTEALERFAAADPDATCRPLASSTDLRRADAMVDAFRHQPAGPHVW